MAAVDIAFAATTKADAKAQLRQRNTDAGDALSTAVLDAVDALIDDLGPVGSNLVGVGLVSRADTLQVTVQLRGGE